MARNTKFLGFSGDNNITLERWGGKATIALSKESIGALRAACYSELPKEPQRRRIGLDNSYPSTHYNDELDHIAVAMPPKYVEELLSILEPLAREELARGGNKLGFWLSDLSEALDLRKEYLNTEDEPGL